MSTLWFAPGVLTLLALAAAPSLAQAETLSGSEAASAREGVFQYPLRSGESLNDVARVFRVPVRQLIELNRIADPNQLRTGQLIQVPDSFAQEAGMLRAERDRLLREKQEGDRESAGRQQAIAGLVERISELEREKESLGGQLAATGHWERGAKVLSLVLLGLFAWLMKIANERSMLARRLRVVTAENGVLATAKEKYRDAVGQVELRFQQLYSGRSNMTREIITDGTTRLRRTFADGALQIERLITSVKLEREKEEQLLEAEQKMFGWLAHPVREVIARHRLKEHES